jgi:DNA-binding HxlR family transcriptional regulator
MSDDRTLVLARIDPPAIDAAEPNDIEMVRGTQSVLDLLARKWSVGVLYLLARGTRRYSELFYEVGEVSKKALTQTLRALESDGLVVRRAYPEVPMRVEYSLSRLGWSMTPLLMTMYEWSEQHVQPAHERLADERLADERLAA